MPALDFPTIAAVLEQHSLIVALIILMCVDYLTGTIVAFVTKKPNSRANMTGVARKALVLILLFGLAVVERATLLTPEFPHLPYVQIASYGFLAAEFWSIIENSREAGVMPAFLNSLFDTLTANLRKAGGEKE